MDSAMMNLTGDAAIIHYHKHLIETYGTESTGALGWMQAEGQYARFEMLSRIGDMNGCSVLDAGCGHADLFSFLKDKYPTFTYYGYEQMPGLLNVAARRYKGEQNITLRVANFLQEALPPTDYILASGSLNYRHEDVDFIYKAIATLYAQCRRGLGFNLLSSGVDADTVLIAYDAKDIARFSYTLSDKVVLHRRYWKDDFTVFMYK